VIWEKLLKQLSAQDKLDLSLLALDGMLIPSYGFRERTGFSWKHGTVGVKISTVVDAAGLPLGVSLAQGWVHDASLARRTIDNMRLTLPPAKRTINADRGYDGFALRSLFDRQGMAPNIRKRRRTGKRAGFEHLYNYDKDVARERYVVERTNAWFKSFRRLHFRFDRSAYSFDCLLWLAVLIICVRRLTV
jgi:transposase